MRFCSCFYEPLKLNFGEHLGFLLFVFFVKAQGALLGTVAKPTCNSLHRVADKKDLVVVAASGYGAMFVRAHPPVIVFPL